MGVVKCGHGGPSLGHIKTIVIGLGLQRGAHLHGNLITTHNERGPKIRGILDQSAKQLKPHKKLKPRTYTNNF